MKQAIAMPIATKVSLPPPVTFFCHLGCSQIRTRFNSVRMICDCEDRGGRIRFNGT
jgi:hypothetical protein